MQHQINATLPLVLSIGVTTKLIMNIIQSTFFFFLLYLGLPEKKHCFSRTLHKITTIYTAVLTDVNLHM